MHIALAADCRRSLAEGIDLDLGDGTGVRVELFVASGGGQFFDDTALVKASSRQPVTTTSAVENPKVNRCGGTSGAEAVCGSSV